MKYFAMAFATGVLMASAACAEPVTLRVSVPFGDESETVPVNYALAKLKELMPDVTVTLEKIPQTDEYNTKVLAAAKTNSLPDVLYIRGGVFEPLASAGKLADLSGALAADGLKARYNTRAQILLDNWKGKTLAMPEEDTWTATLFYNTKVFEDAGIAAPTNFDELLEATKSLAGKGFVPLTLPMNGNWMALQILDGLVSRTDPRGMLALQEGAKMSDPVFTKAVENFKALIDAGLIGSRASAYEESVNLLTTGKAGMIMNGAWMMKDLASAIPNEAGILFLPFGTTADEGATNASGGPSLQGYAAAAGGKNEAVAVRFAAWLGYYVTEAKVIKRAYPSPFVDPSIKYEGKLLSFQQSYFDHAAKYTSMTAFPWGLKREVDVLLEDTLGEFVTGAMSSADFIATMDAKLPRALR